MLINIVFFYKYITLIVLQQGYKINLQNTENIKKMILELGLIESLSCQLSFALTEIL